MTLTSSLIITEISLNNYRTTEYNHLYAYFLIIFGPKDGPMRSKHATPKNTTYNLAVLMVLYSFTKMFLSCPVQINFRFPIEHVF